MLNLLKNLFNFIMGLFGRTQVTQNGWNSKDAEKNAGQIGKQDVIDMYGKEYVIPRKLELPVSTNPAVITSPFGTRYLQGVKQFHIGVDFKTVTDADTRMVRAVEDGVIKKVLLKDNDYPCLFKWSGTKWVSAGVPKGRAWTPYVVLIGKYTKNKYVYKHVQSIVKEGQEVRAGDLIAQTGNYGYSMGEHLHFEYYDWLEDKGTWADPSDPIVFFRKMGIDVKNNIAIEIEHGQLMKMVAE